jgi:hypothetical protein
MSARLPQNFQKGYNFEDLQKPWGFEIDKNFKSEIATIRP